MTGKELKEKLQTVDENIEVMILTDTPDGLFCFTESVADVVGMPIDEYTDKEEQVFVLAWPELLPEEDDDRPTLKVVKWIKF